MRNIVESQAFKDVVIGFNAKVQEMLKPMTTAYTSSMVDALSSAGKTFSNMNLGIYQSEMVKSMNAMAKNFSTIKIPVDSFSSAKILADSFSTTKMLTDSFPSAVTISKNFPSVTTNMDILSKLHMIPKSEENTKTSEESHIILKAVDEQK